MSEVLDVLVVGAGPAGLTLAADLVRRGVTVRIVDRSPASFPGSRAKGIQPRTLEVFDDLGVLSRVAAIATTYPDLAIHKGSDIVTKPMYQLFDRTDDVPQPNTLLLAQYDTDAAIGARLVELGGVIEYASELVDFSQDADGVSATLRRENGEEETVRSRYLVGADGGASPVRWKLGIDFPGTTDESDRMIVADVTLENLSRDFWHMWPDAGGRTMGLCPLPGGEKFQLMLKLRPDESAEVSTDYINDLVHASLGNSDLIIREVQWTSIWRPNIRIAERYRDNRVFLVGDAAHVHPPAGAQGMNTGIQDSYNLSWKLAQVIAGAPEALLDTYQAERQPVAARVLGLASELYESIKVNVSTGLERGDEERQLRLSYAGHGLAAAADVDSDSLTIGDRAPDGRVILYDGTSTSLHDAFRGPHFTLLAFGPSAIAAADAIWPERGADLRVLRIPEPGESVAASYRISDDTQIVVRPDGYIGSVATADFDQALAEFRSLIAPGISA